MVVFMLKEAHGMGWLDERADQERSVFTCPTGGGINPPFNTIRANSSGSVEVSIKSHLRKVALLLC